VVVTEGEAVTREEVLLDKPTVGLHTKPVALLTAVSEVEFTPTQIDALEALKTSVGKLFTTTEAEVEAVQLLTAVTVK